MESMPYGTSGIHMHSRVSFGCHSHVVVDRADFFLLCFFKVKKLRLWKWSHLLEIR